MLVSEKVLNKKFYNIEFEEKVLSIGRVVKVVKGGRIFSFSVLVVIGNKNSWGAHVMWTIGGCPASG